VRFLPNMLAGVGAVDACLFVVAASEGWKPQSEEHLRILELVGVTHGAVALTKVGLVDDDTVELARLEIAERVAGSPLDGADVVAVDAPTGVGMGALRLSLDRLIASTPAAADRGRARLWVDRSFAIRGAGTVVTGTLTGGTLAVDDEVEITGPTAGRRQARVRGLQTLGRDIDAIGPGNRVAANLAGAGRSEVARGDAVVHPERWHRTTVVDATLDVLAALDHDVSRRGAWLAYIGSGEHPVRVRVLGDAAVARGGRGLVRLHLAAPLPLQPGDRYVLRESGRGETVGGGEVLDVAPVLTAARARPDASAARVVRERRWVDAAELARLLGREAPDDAGIAVGRWIVAPEALDQARASVRDLVDAAGDLGLDVATLDERERAALASLDDVTVAGGRARAGGAEDALAGHPFVAELEASPFAPPSAAEAGVDRAELRELVRRGAVVERDGLHFAPAAVTAAGQVVARLLADTPEGVTVAQIRDALGTTRKYVMPLVGLLDAAGMTRRRGDLRIAGPRLPTA
jgi:selenocysteine-specific elongation factor